MTQLELYHSMKCPTDLDSQPDYQRWLYQRVVKMSNSTGTAPHSADIFRNMNRDSHTKGQSNHSLAAQQGEEPGPTSATFPHLGKEADDHGIAALSTKAAVDPVERPQIQPLFRCRRCRTQLATSAFVVKHDSQKAMQSSHGGGASCAHVFVDPLSWMKPELEKGSMSGKLECPNPRCKQNVGKYAWQGMKCSCGEWVVPGISLLRGKLDEVIHKSTLLSSSN